MPKRRDFLGPAPRIANDDGRRIKIEAWKNFVAFRGNNICWPDDKKELMTCLEIYLNRTIDNLNFTYRPINRKGFICKRAKYNFFGQDIDCWMIRLNITDEIFNNLSFKLLKKFNILIKIYADENAFYYSEWNNINEKE